MFVEQILINNNFEMLQKEFNENKPFEHIILDNFINTSSLLNEIKELDKTNWREFNRAGSYMRELWHFDPINTPIAYQLSNELNSGCFIKWLEKVSGISGLIP